MSHFQYIHGRCLIYISESIESVHDDWPEGVTLVSFSVAQNERQILSVLNSCGSEPTEEG